MSITRKVADAIIERGESTADDVAHLFPDLTLAQVRKAVHNAVFIGLLEKRKDGGGSRRKVKSPGRNPNVYGAPTMLRMRPVADVFRVWG